MFYINNVYNTDLLAHFFLWCQNCCLIIKQETIFNIHFHLMQDVMPCARLLAVTFNRESQRLGVKGRHL